MPKDLLKGPDGLSDELADGVEYSGGALSQ